MKAPLRLPLAPLLVLLLLGCGKAPAEKAIKAPAAAPGQVADSPYYPLKIGTKWTYKGGKTRMTAEVVRHEDLGGLACAVIENRREGKVLRKEHVQATAEGVFLVGVEGRRLKAPVRLLKAGPKPGDHWETQSRDGRRRDTYLIEAGDVTVPAGTFATVIVRGEIVEDGRRTSAFAYWFAKDVGIVKQMLVEGGRTTVYELECFEGAK
jgi:hypothetical protein